MIHLSEYEKTLIGFTSEQNTKALIRQLFFRLIAALLICLGIDILGALQQRGAATSPE
jgi:hypothetical protein